MFKNKLKTLADELGFFSCGIAPANILNDDKNHLQKWLDRGMHGEMKFMENYFDKRTDPRLLVEDAQSVLVFLMNYYTTDKQVEGSPIVSKYAFGNDYHYVLKTKLQVIQEQISAAFPDSQSRCFVDSAPILEKAWAKQAGLGWFGKNTLLITPEQGSFFFIGVILTSAFIEPDTAFEKDLCGSCTKCLNACPTNALIAPHVLDSKKCISYLTIEYRNELPIQYKNKMQERIFGCDICQDVCPWNSKAKQHSIEAFSPKPNLVQMTKEHWKNLSRSDYKKLFKHTALERTGYKNLKRNIDFMD